MNIDGWLVDSVTVRFRTGVDAHGAPVYGPQTVIPVRLESANNLTLVPNKPALVFKHAFASIIQITPDDQVWLTSLGDDVTQSDQARRVLQNDFAYTKTNDFTLYFSYL